MKKGGYKTGELLSYFNRIVKAIDERVVIFFVLGGVGGGVLVSGEGRMIAAFWVAGVPGLFCDLSVGRPP